jgi:3-hydroxyisobutyrate dehydrogenase-like beta-hydroxyacid dehydrogenase
VRPLREHAPPAIALLGLGEAGSALAGDLVARGAEVHGYDPDPARRPDGVLRCETIAGAVRAAGVVLSVNAQAVAVRVAREAAPALAPGALFADLNTTSAAVKAEAAAAVSPVAFVDVALLGPVPPTGLATPCLASGEGAERFAEVFGAFDMPVEIVAGGPGAASMRKLVRSVFMKGLGAAVVESLAAAEAAGCESWLRQEIAAVLAAGEPFVTRLVEGSRQHATRRIDEMEAAAALERELGLEPHVAGAAVSVLRGLT